MIQVASPRLPIGRMLAGALVLLCACAVMTGSAGADGDPASDVLAVQRVFLPQDAGATAPQQAALAGVVQAANRQGTPVRVAVISSRSDLGSIGVLWRRPQEYARFLDEELSLMFHGQLLVAMPNGFGLGHPDAAQAAAVARVRPAAGPRLVAAATRAVEAMAAAAGHALATPAASAGPTPRASGGLGTAAWLALIVGGLLVLGAWAASLRRRPFGPLRKTSPGAGP